MDIRINSNKVFCDTSFFYSHLDINEATHSKAKDIIDHCIQKKIQFYVTWEIISETITLLRYRLSYAGAVRFIDEIIPVLNIINLDVNTKNEALSLFKKHSRDKKLSYCDIVSYLVATKILNNIPCLAFDVDFERLGLIVVK